MTIEDVINNLTAASDDVYRSDDLKRSLRSWLEEYGRSVIDFCASIVYHHSLGYSDLYESGARVDLSYKDVEETLDYLTRTIRRVTP